MLCKFIMNVAGPGLIPKQVEKFDVTDFPFIPTSWVMIADQLAVPTFVNDNMDAECTCHQ